MREKRREEEAGRSKKEQERERGARERRMTQCTSLGVSYIGLLLMRERTTMGSVWWMRLVLLLIVRMSTSAGLAYTWTLSG